MGRSQLSKLFPSLTPPITYPPFSTRPETIRWQAQTAMASSDKLSKPKRGGGPRTPTGKERSSQNSFQHGNCCRAHVILPHESQTEYDELSESVLREFEPCTSHEWDLVQQIIDARWRMLRSDRNLFQLESVLYGKENNMALWSPEQIRKVELFQRYKTRDTNAFHKQVRLLESHRKSVRQADKEKEAFVASNMDDLALPDKVAIAKEFLRDFVYKAYAPPLDRTDGGCQCLNCRWKWGLAERDRLDEIEEQQEQNKLA